MRSPELKNRSNLADFEKFRTNLYRSLDTRRVRKARKRHLKALLILNVPDVNRFEVRNTVSPVTKGQNSQI